MWCRIKLLSAWKKLGMLQLLRLRCNKILLLPLFLRLSPVPVCVARWWRLPVVEEWSLRHAPPLLGGRLARDSRRWVYLHGGNRPMRGGIHRVACHFPPEIF